MRDGRRCSETLVSIKVDLQPLLKLGVSLTTYFSFHCLNGADLALQCRLELTGHVKVLYATPFCTQTPAYPFVFLASVMLKLELEPNLPDLLSTELLQFLPFFVVECIIQIGKTGLLSFGSEPAGKVVRCLVVPHS